MLRLFFYRTSAGLSLRELSGRCEEAGCYVSPSFLNRLERGENTDCSFQIKEVLQKIFKRKNVLEEAEE